MSNTFDACLAELAACQGTERGTPALITIGEGDEAQTVACVIQTDQFNSAFPTDGGGETESGIQQVMVQKSLLTPGADWVNGEPPINYTPTSIDGVSQYVIGVNQIQGVLYITTGQPAGQ